MGAGRGIHLVDADADGAEPDDQPRPSTNEHFLTRNPDGSGGSLTGRYDDAAVFDTIATLVDAHARPRPRRRPPPVPDAA